MAYTVWERLARADLGSDPADKAKGMKKVEERFILAQDDYELAKMAIILGHIPDWRQGPSSGWRGGKQSRAFSRAKIFC